MKLSFLTNLKSTFILPLNFIKLTVPERMLRQLACFLLMLNFFSCDVFAQGDSSKLVIEKLTGKYASLVERKINTYTHRLQSKTEKTLTRLARWENKVQALLQKVNPEAASRLFADPDKTFAGMLQKYQKGGQVLQNYKTSYDTYRDQLVTQVKFLEDQKENLDESQLAKLTRLKETVEALDDEATQSEAMQQFMKERKRQLIQQSMQYIGRSKYLQKINKESFYYLETLKNYKELFANTQKVEKAVIELLTKIPEFQNFSQQNSSLSGLFAMPVVFPGIPIGSSSIPLVNGFAPRLAIQQSSLVGMRSNSAGIIDHIQSNLPSLSNGVDEIKDKIGVKSSKKSTGELPDFVPNSQRTKTFKQRLEYGSDVQFSKSVNYLPATSTIALRVGYKISDKNSAGFGVSYIAGLGKGWEHLKISSEGMGVRTYLKWKIKYGLNFQGGAECTYLSSFKKISDLNNKSPWQKAALAGISKTTKSKKKMQGDIQLLIDFLHNQHNPVTSLFLFRYGYNF